MSHNYLDWAKYQYRHRYKSIRMIKLSSCQNDSPIILEKYQLGHSYTFITMPILLLSPNNYETPSKFSQATPKFWENFQFLKYYANDPGSTLIIQTKSPIPCLNSGFLIFFSSLFAGLFEVWNTCAFTIHSAVHAELDVSRGASLVTTNGMSKQNQVSKDLNSNFPPKLKCLILKY